ncbi:Dullard phosphatase domain, eukaryotic, partial [Cynara cardunculus var. scolymus]
VILFKKFQLDCLYFRFIVFFCFLVTVASIHLVRTVIASEVCYSAARLIELESGKGENVSFIGEWPVMVLQRLVKIFPKFEMQTKKVAMGRNSSKGLGSPKVSRTQKKVSEDVNDQENKVSQMITSSARKQKPGTFVIVTSSYTIIYTATCTRKCKESVDTTNLNARGISEADTNATVCLDNDSYLAINDMSVDAEGYNVTDPFVNGTIFSPAFHISRAAEGEIADGETLVHSTLEPCDDADFTFSVNFNLEDHKVYVRCRPYLKEFMERVASLFEIIIFTASQSIYAEQLLNVLDPKRKVFRHRVYRESCVFLEGNYLKDLSVLGRDLSRAFGFQIDNGIPIESWFDDRSDQELLSLLPFLESLVGVEDVRPFIAKKFNLREKIAAAVCPLGEAFER